MTSYQKPALAGEGRPNATLAAVNSALRGIARERINERPDRKRKPKIAMRFDLSDQYQLVAEVGIKKVRDGFAIAPNIALDLRPSFVANGLSATGKGIGAQLQPDGSLRLSRWNPNRDNHEEQLAAVADFLERLGDDPFAAIKRNSTNCALCGRALTDDRSRARGFGPECVKSADAIARLLEAKKGGAR
jgi:hypothetical protein